MTDAELKAVAEACKRATPGPWKRCPKGVYILAADGSPVTDIDDFENLGPIRMRGHGAEVSGNRPAGSQDANAEFICNARTWIPQLVDRVRDLEERLRVEYEGRTRALQERNAALKRVRELQDERA